MRPHASIPSLRRLPAALAACLVVAGCGGGTKTTKPPTPKPAAPEILGFVAADAQVVSGTGTKLTAYFTGGTGTVDGGVGAVKSGTPVTVTPTATTPYTLTVTGDGGTRTATATVTLVDGASLEVSFGGDVPPAPQVAVVGPDGTTTLPTQATTLTGLVPGDYQVVAASALDAGVAYQPTVTGSPVTLTAGGSATVEVDWRASDTPPRVSWVRPQYVVPQAPTVISFTVSDAEDPPSALTVTATPKDTSVLPASALALGGTGADRTLTITSPGPAGDTAVELAVTDTAGHTTTETVPVALVTQVVTTAADAGAGSLRAVMGAAPAGSAVAFAPGLQGPITLTSGVLSVDHDLKILGPGAGALALDGGGTQGLFDVKAGATLQVSALTFQHAKTAVHVEVGGVLRVWDAAFVDNAAVIGAGIFDEGEATVTRSLFKGNVTDCGAGCGTLGGAVSVLGNSAAASFAVSDSTFTGNVAKSAGGSAGAAIGATFFYGGTVAVRGCTVTGNLCQGHYCGGGAISMVARGMGVTASPLALLSIANSIVAGNTGGSPADVIARGDPLAPIRTSSHTDVLGDLDGLTLDPTDLTGVVDPKLSALGDHGGPTATLVPLPGSPALGLRVPTTFGGDPVDQRGNLRRLVNGGVASDAGAVDRLPTDPTG